MKYVERIDVIEAVQWFPGDLPEIVRPVVIDGNAYGALEPLTNNSEYHPYLNEQALICSGDYIQTYEDGSHRIRRQHDFERNFVPHFDHCEEVNIEIKIELLLIRILTLIVENTPPPPPPALLPSPYFFPNRLPGFSPKLLN